MKFIKFLILFFPVSFSLSASKFCSKKESIKDTESYVLNIPGNSCININDCWITFNAPSEKFEFFQNSLPFLNFNQIDSYFAHHVIIERISLKKAINKIELKVFDSYKIKRAPNEICILLGSYKEVRANQMYNWFIKTGGTLMSSYFLFVISVFLIFVTLITRIKLAFELLLYSSIAAIYLLSFSEYPREFYSPILLSGPIHFPLRLFQDFLLVRVFGELVDSMKFKSVIKRVSILYIISIGIFPFLFLIGANSYEFYESTIFIVAPLVAAPMAIGSWLAFKLNSNFEKKILIPSFLVLFTFQLNDLFVFWGVINGYFTVKFYIPFIVGLVLFILLRRIYLKSLEIKLDEQKSKLIGNFIHDIQSPLLVLKNTIEKIGNNQSNYNCINSSLNRIQEMVNGLERVGDIESHQHFFPIGFHIESILNEKIEICKNIEFIYIKQNEFFIFGDPLQFQRVICNLLNNSIDSLKLTNANPKFIKISISSMKEHVEIRIRDNGIGLPVNFDRKSFKTGSSAKISGKGIGLSSAQDYINSIGGSIYFEDDYGIGADLRIKLQIIKSNPNFVVKSKNTLENSSIIKLSEDLSLTSFNKDSIYDIGNIKNIKDFVLKFNSISKLFNSSLIVIGSEFQLSSILKISELIEINFNFLYIEKPPMVENVDLILIDDDKMIRDSWKISCNDAKKIIKTYKNLVSFIFSNNFYSSSVPIYCDLTFEGKIETNLLNIIKTEGFYDIRLCTGHSDKFIPNNLKKVKTYPKTPPKFDEISII